MRINNVCPFCGDIVSVRDKTADYVISGRGRFAVKQLLHHKCTERRVERGKKKTDVQT